MSQTNWIAAFLVIGFVAYIIGNDQLQQYAAIVWSGSASSTAQSSAPGSVANQLTNPSSPLQQGATALGNVFSSVPLSSVF